MPCCLEKRQVAPVPGNALAILGPFRKQVSAKLLVLAQGSQKAVMFYFAIACLHALLAWWKPALLKDGFSILGLPTLKPAKA